MLLAQFDMAQIDGTPCADPATVPVGFLDDEVCGVAPSAAFKGQGHGATAAQAGQQAVPMGVEVHAVNAAASGIERLQLGGASVRLLGPVGGLLAADVGAIGGYGRCVAQALRQRQVRGPAV